MKTAYCRVDFLKSPNPYLAAWLRCAGPLVHVSGWSLGDQDQSQTAPAGSASSFLEIQAGSHAQVAQTASAAAPGTDRSPGDTVTPDCGAQN